jgi:Fe-S-cluster containining protein
MFPHAQWKDFQCRRCGKCCTEMGLPYDSQKIGEIARFLGLTVDKVIERYYGRFCEDRKSWVSESHKRTPCPFIMTISDNKKACAIYPIRPKACRQYPLESAFDARWIECPGKMALDKQQDKNVLPAQNN